MVRRQEPWKEWEKRKGPSRQEEALGLTLLAKSCVTLNQPFAHLLASA